MSEGAALPTWPFLTNHGHLLVCTAEDAGIRGSDIAAQSASRSGPRRVSSLTWSLKATSPEPGLAGATRNRSIPMFHSAIPSRADTPSASCS